MFHVEQINNIMAKNDNTKYTYYRLEFKDCNLDFDYTIVENISDIKDWINTLDIELDDDTKKAEIKITGIGMTPVQFKDFLRTLI